MSLLNLIVFVTARDICGFLTLNSRLQIHENATEITFNLKEDFMQRRKVPDRLWNIKITYITGRTNKLQMILPRVRSSTYSNQFLIQSHPHFPATVKI